MIKNKLKAFIDEYFYNLKWKCNACGKENFGEGYFCKDCFDSLPFITAPFCNHCGRKTKTAEEYCSTCKGRLTAIDTGRSIFIYKEPIDRIIRRFKFGKHKYIAEIFTDYLAAEYNANFYEDDFITFVPMTKKALKARGFNQAELLAQKLAERVGKPLLSTVLKVKDTQEQATLSAKDRRVNLKGVFKVKDKKEIAGRSFLLIDDVTTTGETAQTIAEILKKYGAKRVDLLTVASASCVD